MTIPTSSQHKIIFYDDNYTVGNVTTKSATLPFPSTLSKPITFTHLEPNQQYEAIIFITDPHQREYVLEPHIVHVEYNVEKGQLSKLQKDYHELDAKYQELLKQCSPTSTEMIITEVITTDSDLNQTHPSNDDDDDDDDDDESSTKAPNKDDIYMWWVFAGFIVLIVVAVAGYLLYNQRAKVKLYPLDYYLLTTSLNKGHIWDQPFGVLVEKRLSSLALFLFSS